MKVTPDFITTLKSNQIFVFGSNLSGMHGGGAALIAYREFHAIWGQAIGLQGQSYAIPTKSEGIKRSLTIEEIKPFVNEFILFATYRKNLEFLVTEIGCGLAGNRPEQIAPLFKEAKKLENIYLPKSFLKII